MSVDTDGGSADGATARRVKERSRRSGPGGGPGRGAGHPPSGTSSSGGVTRLIRDQRDADSDRVSVPEFR
jgi:hypothetical protein